jgi:excinuclease ABC subunit B
MSIFKLHRPFEPAGSQPVAIAQLVSARPGKSTLLGVTGSGKTFTIAHVIAQQNKPVLVLSPNKTLAAQLYEEFSLFFPENQVCYFVSYYDYYQPESYLPAQDMYIPKETKINSEIERLRIEATASVINRQDTIVVASVSSIYSLGNPSDYKNLAFSLRVGQEIKRKDLLKQLVFIQYLRDEVSRKPGSFCVIGNTIEVHLPYQKDKLRIELFGDSIESLVWVNKLNNTVVRELDNTVVFPAKHFVMTPDAKDQALERIKLELVKSVPLLPKELYRERLQTRVSRDIELLQEVGFCSGIENYSRHFDGRLPGEPPFTLFDFFGDDFLLVIDESHIAIPQLRGMYAGDRARKQSLIDFGFRLPSALDNRPLQFKEIERFFKDVIFISATPSDYELSQSDILVEQVIRPTGLVDPVIELHNREGQIDDLISRIKNTTENGFRTLVTVLTKKLAEELAYFLEGKNIKVCYLHSDIKTPERTELLNKLRMGIFDCLVGVNLLREGLDLPEVALVAIMDADVESFLRDKRSLIQTIGRAARNAESMVVMYADRVTQSMAAAIEETNRRRDIQIAYNNEFDITPRTVKREVKRTISPLQEAIAKASKRPGKKSTGESPLEKLTPHELHMRIINIEREMQEAAERFDFERAIELRGQFIELQKQENILFKK